MFQLCSDPVLSHRLEVQPGVLAEECAQFLRDFFQNPTDKTCAT